MLVVGEAFLASLYTERRICPEETSIARLTTSAVCAAPVEEPDAVSEESAYADDRGAAEF
jgi:hypothetical protein